MPPVDFNCDRWKAEWEAVRIENLSQREIWEQVPPPTARLAMSHDPESADDTANRRD